MNKKIIILIIFAIGLIIITCQERPHTNPFDPAFEGSSSNENSIKIVEVDSTQTNIKEKKIDTTSFHRPIYTIEFVGEIPDYETGDILIDRSGRGKLYFMVEKKSLKKPIGIEALAIQATLDLILENKEITLVTPSNRTKDEVNFDGKLISSPENIKLSCDNVHTGINIQCLNKSFILDLTGIKISSISSNTDLILTIDKGKVTYTPAIDFYLRYGSREVDFINILQDISDITSLFGGINSAIRRIGDFEYLKLITYNDIDIDFSVDVITQAHTDLINEEVLLAKCHTLVAAHALVFSIEASLIFRVNINTNIECDFNFKYKENNNVMLGFEGNGPLDLSFKPQFYHDFQKERECDFQMDSKLSLYEKISIVPRIEVYLYGIIGTSGEIIPYQDLDINAGSSISNYDWDASLGVGLDGDIALNLSAFHFDKLTTTLYKSQNFQFIYFDLYTAPHLQYIAGNNQNGIEGQRLANPFQVKAVDNFDNDIYLPVNVYWEVTKGGGSLVHIPAASCHLFR